MRIRLFAFCLLRAAASPNCRRCLIGRARKGATIRRRDESSNYAAA